ncbi:MAG: hypothetical protein ACFFDT_37300 [Candidatus Hodarchaeota archaeon]
MMICLLLVLSFPAFAAKAGGSGTIELAEDSTYIFFFNDLAQGDKVQYSFSAPSPIDVCFTTRPDAKRMREGHSGECFGKNFPFGQILNALEASGTFEIPNIREFDDDWAVVLTNNNDDEVNVTYQLDLIATYVSGFKTSIQADTLQQIGTQEIDQRGGAFGILFGALEAGSTVTYEFQATEPLDLYILTEEEWGLLEAQMGWEYAYADMETMRGNGRYPVPSDQNWVVAFVNYGKYHISVSYDVNVESSISSSAIGEQTNQEANIQGESKFAEESNQLQEDATVSETKLETKNPPLVHELIYIIPTLAIVTIIAVLQSRIKRI